MFVMSELFVVDVNDIRPVSCQACGRNRFATRGVWLLEPNDTLYSEYCGRCLLARAANWRVPICWVDGNHVNTHANEEFWCSKCERNVGTRRCITCGRTTSIIHTC